MAPRAYVKEASDILPNRFMEPIVDWLHDDMVNATDDVCNGRMVHGAHGARRPDLHRSWAVARN
jgi:hypothetical protein